METVRTKCATCHWGRWEVNYLHCAKCIGFSKWKPLTEPKDPPKPVYIGHRE